ASVGENSLTQLQRPPHLRLPRWSCQHKRPPSRKDNSMNHQGNKKSRAWTIVVASTAVAAGGGATAAASWADTTVSSEAGSLSEQRVLPGTDPALDASASTAAAAQRFNDLAARVGTWTGPSIPAVSGAFATARDLAAAQD